MNKYCMELIIDNVSKQYRGDRWGLRGVTLRLQPGAVGLLGPNGAGKSTLNLSASAHRPLGGFSGGMRQRVGIAQALLNDPKLLIVDEPTVGLDPAERVRFRHLLSDLAGERLVILSTHIVADVEAIATEIAVLHQGRLLTHAAPEALLQAVAGKVWEWVVPTSEVPHLRQQYLISGAVSRADGTHVRAIAAEVPGARKVTASLEDAFLYFTSGGAA